MLSRVFTCARPKQLVAQSCYVLRKAGESRGHRMVQGRWMSSLGNPMFPQRPLPELETFQESIENSKKAKKEGSGGDPGNKGVVDILADHGGKIALVVLAGVIGLVYSYYLSGQDRNKIEDAISEAVYIEPYEIQELRFGNKLSREEYQYIAAQVKAAFPSGQATYTDFMKFLKKDLVLPSTVRSTEEQSQSGEQQQARRGVVWVNGQGRLDLLSTHLLDRMVMGLCLAQATTATTSAASKSGGAENPPASADADAGAEGSVAWAQTPLDVTTLVVILNLAMAPDAEARVQALHSLAAAESNQESSSGGASDTAARGDVLRLIRALIETDQIPPAKQTMESGVKWPVKLYRRKREEDMVKEFETRKKITTPVEAYDYEAFRELLLSYQVCAWGECYNKNDHR